LRLVPSLQHGIAGFTEHSVIRIAIKARRDRDDRGKIALQDGALNEGSKMGIE
jgi:hypothetical protein